MCVTVVTDLLLHLHLPVLPCGLPEIDISQIKFKKFISPWKTSSDWCIKPPTMEETTNDIIKEIRLVTCTLAPFYPPVFSSTPFQQTQTLHSQEFYRLTKPCPWNSHTQASATSINAQKSAHCHHHQFSKTKPSKKPSHVPKPPCRMKSTSLCSKIKNLIAIFWKKSTFLVSSPHKPLKNYNISSNTALISTSTKKD
jgi:hypothetical protein